MSHVGSATQFHRERTTDFDHAHDVAVVLTKQCHCTHGLGLFQRGLDGIDVVVGIDSLVGDGLNLFKLRRRQRFRIVEVEA